jgi:hypothetical protein
MVYPRYRKKMGRKTRRAFRRRARKTGIPRALRNQQCAITRIANLGAFTIPTSATFTGRSFTFQLNQVTAYTELTAVFDEYKFCAVKLIFVPRFDGNDLASASLAAATPGAAWRADPIIYYGVDRDGDQPLTSEVSVMQSSSTKMVRTPNKPFSIYISKPNVKGVLTTSLGYAGAVNQVHWLNSSFPAAEWKGAYIGGYVPEGSLLSAFSYNVYAKFYMKFRKAI